MKKAPIFHRRLRRRLNFSQNFCKPRAFGARPPLLGAEDARLTIIVRKFLPAPKAPVKSWRFFHLENEVYLVKIAFASENLEKFSPPAGYFFVQHL